MRGRGKTCPPRGQNAQVCQFIKKKTEGHISPPELYRRVGLMNAPFPAISHTATRAHFQSFASVFHVNVWLPNGRVSVSGICCVKVLLPSLHTISPNAKGKVH